MFSRHVATLPARGRADAAAATPCAAQGIPSLARSEPGALWQFDATGGLRLPDPQGGPVRQLWFIAGKDDASRLLVGARAYFHAHQAALDDLCKRSFRRWGVPRGVYVDLCLCRLGGYADGSLWAIRRPDASRAFRTGWLAQSEQCRRAVTTQHPVQCL